MTMPRWWALLLLSAVFGMHGIQCMGADASMASSYAAPSSPSSSSVLSGHLSADAAGPVAEPAPAKLPPAATVMHRHSGPSGWMDHLGAVCLAVVSAGLAAIALWILTRRPFPTAVPRPRAHRWPTSLDPPSPPDIYSLCILRT